MATNETPVPHDSDPSFLPLRPRSAPPITTHSFPIIPLPLANQCPCVTDRLAHRIGTLEQIILGLQDSVTTLQAQHVEHAAETARQSATLGEGLDAMELALDASSQTVLATQVIYLAERLAVLTHVLTTSNNAIDTLLDASDYHNERHLTLVRVVELIRDEVYESYPVHDPAEHAETAAPLPQDAPEH